MAEPVRTAGAGRGLSKKWHGAPLWVWIGGGGAVLLGIYIIHKRASGSTASTASASPLQPFGGGGGDLGGGAGGGAGGGSPTGGGLPVGGLTSGSLTYPDGSSATPPAGAVVAPTPGPGVYGPPGDSFGIGPAIGPSPTGYFFPTAPYGSPQWSNTIANLNSQAQAANAAQPRSQWAVTAGAA